MKNVNENTRVSSNVYSYIRCSTERQNWGDSERGQEQMVKDWCQLRGLMLSDKFIYKKTFAWKGKNREVGHLGDLLKVVPPGDAVVIEDNDRFSREDVTTALTSLRGIVDRGVRVVFLKTEALHDRPAGCARAGVERAGQAGLEFADETLDPHRMNHAYFDQHETGS